MKLLNIITILAFFAGSIANAAYIQTPYTVPYGGTGQVSLTLHGLLIGNGASAVTLSSVGATNTVLHGNSGADPTYSDIVNADIDAAAAIAYSKLSLSNSIVNADVNSAAAIA